MKRLLVFSATLLLASCFSAEASTHRNTARAAYENDLRSRMRVVWLQLATKRVDLLTIGRVKLHFEIAPDGDVVNLKIKSNSGNHALADLAIDTVRATRIFPLPKNVLSTLDTKRLPVDFDFYTYATR